MLGLPNYRNCKIINVCFLFKATKIVVICFEGIGNEYSTFQKEKENLVIKLALFYIFANPFNVQFSGRKKAGFFYLLYSVSWNIIYNVASGKLHCTPMREREFKRQIAF